jgi:hypothetical protein
MSLHLAGRRIGSSARVLTAMGCDHVRSLESVIMNKWLEQEELMPRLRGPEEGDEEEWLEDEEEFDDDTDDEEWEYVEEDEEDDWDDEDWDDDEDEDWLDDDDEGEELY